MEQQIITNIDELVIEKSNWPIKIGIKRLIENCSSGEKKNIKNKDKQKKYFKLINGFEPLFLDYKTSTFTKLS